MSNTQEIEGLEFQIAKANEQIAFSGRVARLMANPDFRAVILDKYCVEEAANFAHQSGDPILTVQQRADSLSMAQATGHLKRWLQVTQTIAETLKDRIPEMEEMLAELCATDGEDEE